MCYIYFMHVVSAAWHCEDSLRSLKKRIGTNTQVFCEDTFQGEIQMEEEKKLYIGNLSYETTDTDLKSAIEAKGIAVSAVRVVSDKFTGKSKGFGFAEFATAEEAQKAIDALSGQELGGRKLTVNKAKKMEPRKDGFGGGGNGGRSNGGSYGKNRY
jgi:cold-inducible RNA-binding protein